jgi:hypothetical protein
MSTPSRATFNLYRLLDLTHVPSRFVGTDTLLDATTFANPAATPEIPDPLSATDVYPQYLRPPFNRLSQFRDPGRVNINTINTDRMWLALLGQNPSRPWADIVSSIRGYDVLAPSISRTLLDPEVPPNRLPAPTFFANPVRSPGSGELVPLVGTETVPGSGVSNPDLRRTDIDATLLRSGVANLPFGGDPFSDSAGEPLLAVTSATTGAFNDADRNPYFRYQQLIRLGSTTTTRSNVYAVWITVGYFEVEPAGTNLPPALRTSNANEIGFLYPDGYRLGRELGSDTGEVERHKAFYMLDRSIPVGFEPGQNHNVDRAILLKRFIE